MAATTSQDSQFHYGPRSAAMITSVSDAGPTWCDTLEIRYQTDPEFIEAALPPPLEPTVEPVVRVSVSMGTHENGTAFGEGRITLQARMGDRVGEYPILVVHDQEWSVTNDRERLGLPARFGKLDARITGKRVEYGILREGLNVAHMVGQVSGQEQPAPVVRQEFGFRARRSFERPGVLEADPEIVLITRTIEERRAAKTDGIVRLGGSRLDPIREFKVRRTHGMRLSQQFIDVSARVIGTVPAADFGPYLHHRYDLDPIDRS
jgi:acetoacetate decarboxylase